MCLFMCLLGIIKRAPVMRLFIGMVGSAHQIVGGHYIFNLIEEPRR